MDWRRPRPDTASPCIGLTFGATSTLLNRLEAAGHVTRSRVHTDRRIVTLHSTAGIQTAADGFFDPLGEKIGAVMAAYPPEFLDDFAELLDTLRDTMEAYVVESSSDEEG